jgi:hypothetical protein
MRKCFLFLMCSFGLVSQAQVTQLSESFTKGKTVWILRVGGSFNGVSGDRVDAQEKAWTKDKWDGSFGRSMGGTLSIGFNKSFGSSPLYWGMELGVGMRGFKTEATWGKSGTSTIAGQSIYDSHTKSETVTLNAYNAQLSPFTIGYKYLFNDKMALDVHVGGFGSYDFAGTLKTETTDHIISNSSYGNRNDLKENSSSVDIGDIKNYTNYDFGVIAGVGFWYGHFNIDLTWQRGFISIFDSGDSAFSNAIQVRLGYAF